MTWPLWTGAEAVEHYGAACSRLPGHETAVLDAVWAMSGEIVVASPAVWWLHVIMGWQDNGCQRRVGRRAHSVREGRLQPSIILRCVVHTGVHPAPFFQVTKLTFLQPSSLFQLRETLRHVHCSLQRAQLCTPSQCCTRHESATSAAAASRTVSTEFTVTAQAPQQQVYSCSALWCSLASGTPTMPDFYRVAPVLHVQGFRL